MANEKKDITLKLFEGAKAAADMDYAELKAIVRTAEKKIAAMEEKIAAIKEAIRPYQEQKEIKDKEALIDIIKNNPHALAAAEKVLLEQAEAKKQAKEKRAAKKEAAKAQEANG